MRDPALLILLTLREREAEEGVGEDGGIPSRVTSPFAAHSHDKGGKSREIYCIASPVGYIYPVCALLFLINHALSLALAEN